jgi:hypothetical protein
MTLSNQLFLFILALLLSVPISLLVLLAFCALLIAIVLCLPIYLLYLFATTVLECFFPPLPQDEIADTPEQQPNNLNLVGQGLQMFFSNYGKT